MGLALNTTHVASNGDTLTMIKDGGIVDCMYTIHAADHLVEHRLTLSLSDLFDKGLQELSRGTAMRGTIQSLLGDNMWTIMNNTQWFNVTKLDGTSEMVLLELEVALWYNRCGCSLNHCPDAGQWEYNDIAY